MNMRKSINKIMMVVATLLLGLIVGCGSDTNNNAVTNPNANIFTPTGTVTGVLTDSVTNAAIAKADIFIINQRATTGDQGQFTIFNVPANTPVGTPGALEEYDTYEVVIDFKNVNADIDTFNNATPAPTVKKAKYPSMSYALVQVKYTSLGETSNATATSSTNHDTPVNGFVANMTPKVGKLDGNLKIQVTSGSSFKLEVGATVELLAAEPNPTILPDTATGSINVNAGHLVATATTDANGIASFSSVEAGTTFLARATTTAGLKGTKVVTTEGDGITVSYRAQGPNSSLAVTSTDATNPTIASNVQQGADVAVPAAGTTLDVVFTFNEPIAANNFSDALSADMAANGGLYSAVSVNANGPKASNIPYALAWDTAAGTPHNKLTVSIPAAYVLPAFKYSVNINGALWDGDTLLVGTISGGGAPGSYPGPQNAAMLRGVPAVLTGLNNRNTLVDTAAGRGNFALTRSGHTNINFTTKGTSSIGTPVVTQSSTMPTVIMWPAATNAFSYTVFVDKVTNGAVTTFQQQFTNAASPFDLSTVGAFFTGFANGTVSYNVTVKALNSSGTAGAASNIVAVSFTTIPAAPVITLTNPTFITWPNVTNAASYTVFVDKVQNGVVTSYQTSIVNATSPFNLNGQDIFTGFGGFTSYNVTVKAIGAFNTPGPVSNVVVVSDRPVPAAPVITQPFPAINPTVITWPAVTNAAEYTVFVDKLVDGVVQNFQVEIFNDNRLTFNLADEPIFNVTPPTKFSSTATYNVTVKGLNSNGTAGPASNVVTVSPIAAPTDLHVRAAAAGVTSTIVDWTAVTGAVNYGVYVDVVIDGVSMGYKRIDGFFGFGSIPTPGINPTADIGPYIDFLAMIGDVAPNGFSTWDQKPVVYNVKVNALDMFGVGSARSAETATITDLEPPTVTNALALPGRPTAAAIPVSTTLTGTMTVQFSQPMVYTSVIDPTKWSFTTGAQVATVTVTFGAATSATNPVPISYNTNTNTATVPWKIVTDATGTVAAPVAPAVQVQVNFAGTDIAGLGMAAGGF